jgi:GDP-4-dehydro-6-deoxy-D-mannose reductase
VAGILVTGAAGFVGGHLLPALRAAFAGAPIVGTGLAGDADEILDITDRAAAARLLARLQPDFCIHLAGISAIGAAKADPGLAWDVNFHGTLNIAGGILAGAPACRMIFISSSECYGGSFRPGLRLDESAPLAPMNLYAATKAAAEMALCALAADGLRLLRLRPFNHTGPGQREDFVVPAFAGQIARIEAGQAPPEIAVGALTPERDFLDIRDICAAYVASVAHFDSLPNNQVLNLCSGRAVTIGDVLGRLLALSRCPITVRQDPGRLRPVEIARATGDPARALAALNWQPRCSLDQTLRSVLEAARRGVSAP